MKYKHLFMLLMLILDIGGFWWIRPEITLLGIISVFSLTFTFLLGGVFIAENWDEKMFKRD